MNPGCGDILNVTLVVRRPGLVQVLTVGTAPYPQGLEASSARRSHIHNTLGGAVLPRSRACALAPRARVGLAQARLGGLAEVRAGAASLLGGEGWADVVGYGTGVVARSHGPRGTGDVEDWVPVRTAQGRGGGGGRVGQVGDARSSHLAGVRSLAAR